jgi:septum formation protein
VQRHSRPSALILASASPRRRELLEQAGVVFSVIPSNAEEHVLDGEAPTEYALRVAQAKAHEVAQHHPGHWVLGADTIVVTAGQILGKPRDRADAKRMLCLLSGQTHQVMTAFVLIAANGQEYRRQLVATTVIFESLSNEQIDSYLDTGEPFDKAGAYAVQGLGAALVEQVEGSYTNVVGLPLDEVLASLYAAGLYPAKEKPPS